MDRVLQRRRWLYAGLSAIALLIGLVRAYEIRWVCDDAFITFRYVDNLLGGHGLVYNVGERVEGYTHFLWLCLVALLRWIGFEPIAATEGLGLLFFGGTLLLVAMIPLRLHPVPVLPIAALMLALHFDFQVWATGGLETSLFTFLTVLLLYLVAVSGLGRRWVLRFAGVVAGLLVMTRPDGLIFVLFALAYVAARLRAARLGRRETLGMLVSFLTPLGLLLLPYGFWKVAYYGSLLPNTYYAKSGGGFYFDQGFFYVWLYLKAYLSSFLLLAGVGSLIALTVRPRERGSAGRLSLLLNDRTGGTLSLAILFVLGYVILFVARVGGDFMYARFLHPAIPFVYLAGEIGLRSLLGRRTAILLIATVGLGLLVVHEKSRRDALYVEKEGMTRKTQQHRGIADEHWYWSHESSGGTLIERYEAIGKELSRYFEGQEVRVLLGGQASLGYYARFPVCIEYAGLTDRTIARQPVAKRGRPGHEKGPTDEYLIGRGVHFTFLKAPFHDAPYRFVHFRVAGGSVRAEMFTYDRALMAHLRKRFPNDVAFVDFEEYLGRWIDALPQMPRNQAERERAEFEGFYFRHNRDPERQARITALLGRPASRPRVP